MVQKHSQMNRPNILGGQKIRRHIGHKVQQLLLPELVIIIIRKNNNYKLLKNVIINLIVNFLSGQKK